MNSLVKLFWFKIDLIINCKLNLENSDDYGDDGICEIDIYQKTGNAVKIGINTALFNSGQFYVCSGNLNISHFYIYLREFTIMKHISHPPKYSFYEFRFEISQTRLIDGNQYRFNQPSVSRFANSNESEVGIPSDRIENDVRFRWHALQGKWIPRQRAQRLSKAISIEQNQTKNVEKDRMETAMEIDCDLKN